MEGKTNSLELKPVEIEMQQLSPIAKNTKPKNELDLQIETTSVKSLRQMENLRPDSALKPRLSTSKYVNLIDQSDLKWFTEISGNKLKDELSGISVKSAATDKNVLGNNVKKKERLLSYAPIICPISNCDILFLPNDMIMHFLSFHHGPRAPAQKLSEKQRLLITIEPFELVSEEITCLGLVSYCGKTSKSDALLNLVERNACVEQNLFLYRSFESFKGDYPIYILASVTSTGVFSDLPEKKEDQVEENKEAENNSTLLIIWLAGADIKIPLASTITTYDECRLYSRSVIVGVHSIFECQSPFEVCNADDGYFRLHFNELSTFANDKMSLKLEIVFHEDFVISLEK